MKYNLLSNKTGAHCRIGIIGKYAAMRCGVARGTRIRIGYNNKVPNVPRSCFRMY